MTVTGKNKSSIKKYMKKERQIWDAVQFLYIDGIDGEQTEHEAKKLGLSTNPKSSSKLWEIQTGRGWKIVEHSDWILSENTAGIIHYIIMSDKKFKDTMIEI